jgi:small subunit ribosomal protein S1
LTEDKQGGSEQPTEANAEATAAEQTVGAIAVADEPVKRPSLEAEAETTETTATTAAPTAEALAPETATPADVAAAEPEVVASRVPDSTPVAEAEADAAIATADPADDAPAVEMESAPATTAEAADLAHPVADVPAASDADTTPGEADASAATAEAPAAAEADATTAAEPEAPEATAGADAPAVAEADAPAATAEADAPAVTAEAETPAVTADAEPEAPAPAPAPAAPTGPEPTTMEELLAEQDADIKSFKHGDVVEGSVVRIDKDEILVDIGAKSEGVVSNRELFGRNAESQPALAIGDTVLVYVLQPESPEGHVVLSLRRAGLERKWRSMQEQFEAGVIIEAPVIDHNKGGLIVDCGIRGFVPISQIVDFPRRPQNDQPRDAAQEIAEKLQPFVGRKLRLKILEVNRKANRLILSEKVALYEERREKRDELFSSLQVGQRVTGHVRSIAPFGVFVDLGGIDGLVHKSELSWNKVNNPEGGYRVGEEVEAEVIDINHERGRISLSIRRLQPDPWHSTVADFKVGDIIDGTVTKLVNFGAFVRVRDGLEGLIHISELSNQRVAHPGDVVHEGQSLKLRIISLDSERHRLGLSLKQAEEAPARPASDGALTGTAPIPAMRERAERAERGERPERGDRRPRGDRERTRSYSASDAVQEPEGGIDTTLAAAFAGVREQLARAEAEDDVDGGAADVADAPAADAEVEAPVAEVAEAPAAEADEAPAAEAEAAPDAEAEAPEAEAPEAEVAEPAPEPETAVEAAAEAVTAPEAVAEPVADEASAEEPAAEPATAAAEEPATAAAEEPAPEASAEADEPAAADEAAADTDAPAEDDAKS